MAKQIWKDVVGYEGLYQVSNEGRVKSLRWKTPWILNRATNKYGYFIVTLFKDKKGKTKTIHQLVAAAFLGHIPNGYVLVVDHINHNPKDNRVENLQIITHRENMSKDKFRLNPKSQYVGVVLQQKSKKWIASIGVKYKHFHIGVFDNEIDAANAYKEALKKLES